MSTKADPGTAADPNLGRGAGFLAETHALARLAAPIVTGFLASSGMVLVDTALVGPLGAVPLAALSLVTSILILFHAALYGFAGPVGLFAGRAHGSGEEPRLGRIARAGAVLALGGGLVGAALMAAGLLTLPRLGQPPEVVAAVAPYWLWMAATLLPYAMGLVPKLLLEATDLAWVAVVPMLLALAVKIPLSWGLIHGHLGLPAWGLAGAGMSSFLATLGATLLLWGYVRLAPAMRPWWGGQRRCGVEVRAQVREGLPMAVQYVLEGAAVAMTGLMVGLLGAVALAATQVVALGWRFVRALRRLPA